MMNVIKELKVRGLLITPEVNASLNSDKYIAISEKTLEFYSELHEDSLIDPEEFIKQVEASNYVISSQKQQAFVHKSVAVPVVTDSDKNCFIPSYFTGRAKTLKSVFNIIEIEDNLYYSDSSLLTQARDTENYILKENGYMDVVSCAYYENKSSLVHSDVNRGFIHKDSAIKCVDTEGYVHKNSAHAYVNEDGETIYYAHRNNVPGRSHKTLHFNETVIREPQELPDRTIGIELEYDNAVKLSRKVFEKERLKKLWSVTYDGSIDRNIGGELISVPITIDELDIVEEMMLLASDCNSTMDDNCGFHVHIGARDLSFKDITAIINLAKNTEDDMYKIAKVSEERKNSRYCKPLDDIYDGFLSNYSKKNALTMFYGSEERASERQLGNKYWRQRYYWINIDRCFRFANDKQLRTIEFRQHPSIESYEDFENFILLCYYFVEYAVNNLVSKCKNSTLEDIVESADIKHKEQLKKYIN